MIESYFEIRMWLDYIIPISIVIVIILFILMIHFYNKMGDFHDKRNKWIDDDEGEEE